MNNIEPKKVWILIITFISMIMWLSHISNGTTWASFLIIAGHWTLATILINKKWMDKNYYGTLALVLVLFEFLKALLGKFTIYLVIVLLLVMAYRAAHQKIMQDAADNLINAYKQTRNKK